MLKNLERVGGVGRGLAAEDSFARTMFDHKQLSIHGAVHWHDCNAYRSVKCAWANGALQHEPRRRFALVIHRNFVASARFTRSQLLDRASQWLTDSWHDRAALDASIKFGRECEEILEGIKKLRW